MCRECSDSTGDPRAAAFQSFLMVEAVPVSDLKKVEQGGIGYVTQVMTSNAREAEEQALALVDSQATGPSAVRVLPLAVCLN